MPFPSYQELASEYANQYGVPTDIFTSVIQAESGFNPGAYNSSSGATGIAQILPSTAANPGFGLSPVDPTNPTDALQFAAQYLRALYNKLGSWTGALNAYSGNTSGGSPYPQSQAVQNALANNGANPATS